MDLVPIIIAVGDEGGNGGAVSPFREAIGGTLAEAWQAIVGDRVAAWRVSNAAKISKKLSEKFKKNGVKIDGNSIPQKYAFTWFEEASKQDKPEVQEIFATLLANASSGNVDALSERNIEIVSKLNPISASIMDLIFQRVEVIRGLFEGHDPIYQFDMTENSFHRYVSEELGSSHVLECEDLIRIGILQEYIVIDSSSISDKISDIKSGIDKMSSSEIDDGYWKELVEVQNCVRLSEIGWSLFRAIYPEKYPDREAAS